MSYDHHGGECCGVSHVFNFANAGFRATAGDKRRWLDRQIEAAVNYRRQDNLDENQNTGEFTVQMWGRGKFGHLIEVCLTDNQMMEWAPILKEKGFRIAQRFKNDNSGNYVTLLTYVTKRPAKKAPYTW